MKKFEKYYGWIVAFLFCVAVIVVYKTFDNISNITKSIGTIIGAAKPFLIAFIIAYILNMPAKRLQKHLEGVKNSFIKTHAAGLSILAVYVFSVIVLAVILWVLIPALYRNLIDLYNNFPNYITAFENYISGFEIARKFGLTDINLYTGIEKVFSSIDMTQFGKYAQGVFSVTTGVFDIFIAIIASIYMLLDKARLQREIVRIIGLFVNKKTLTAVVGYAKRINDIFTNYIYCRLVCSVIMAIASSIVLMVLKVRYALILGIFIGAMDMIPYFGSIIACVITIIVTLITGGLWKGVWVGVVLLIMQQLDGNLLGPKIMGDSLEIRPLWIIFAVSVGGTLFGFIGMLISVPVLAIVRVIASDFMSAKEEKMRQTAERNSDET